MINLLRPATNNPTETNLVSPEHFRMDVANRRRYLHVSILEDDTVVAQCALFLAEKKAIADRAKKL